MSLTNLSLAERLSMEAAAHREAMAANPRARVARVARPCPITGSEDENLREYAIPREYQTMSWEDFLRLSISASREAKEGDVEGLETAANLWIE